MTREASRVRVDPRALWRAADACAAVVRCHATPLDGRGWSAPIFAHAALAAAARTTGHDASDATANACLVAFFAVHYARHTGALCHVAKREANRFMAPLVRAAIPWAALATAYAWEGAGRSQTVLGALAVGRW